MDATRLKMKIEVVDDDTSPIMAEKSNAGMSRMAEESYNEARALVNKFTQWRKESQRNLVKIVASYNKSLDESFNDLVKEVSDLHAKVSVIKNELHDSFVTVDSHNEPSSNSPVETDLIEPEEKPSMTDEKIKALQRRFGSSIIISSKTGHEDKEHHLYDGNIELRDFRRQKHKKEPQNISPSNEEVSFSHSIFEYDVKNDVADDEVLIKELAASNIHDNMHKYIILGKQRFDKKAKANANGELREKGIKLKCEHCQYETLFKRDLKKHLNDEHDYRKWECDRCPFVTRSSKYVLMTHINALHDKILKYKCDQCEYAAKVKANLYKHKIFVHKMGDKKFKCEKCPYASRQSGNLKKHVEHVHEKIPHIKDQTCELCGFTSSRSSAIKKHKDSVHKQGEKKFKCEQCPFASLRNEHLKRHIEGVHEKKKEHVCDECGHMTSQKSDLKSHMATVHKMGDKLKCDQCTTVVYSQRNLKQHVRSVHLKTGRDQKRKEKGKEAQQQQDVQQQQEDKEQLQEGGEEKTEDEREQHQEDGEQHQEDREQPREGEEIGQVQDESESEESLHSDSSCADDAVEIS